MQRSAKIRSLATGFLLTALLAGGVGAATAQDSYDFNLPSQPLADSLRAVGSLASVNVVFEPSSVEARRAPGLTGAYSVKEALSRLLDGSGLDVMVTEGGSFVIGRREIRPDAVGQEAGRETAIRLAQAQTTTATQDGAPQSAPKVDDATELEEIVVTGTHIRGSRNDTAPIMVIDREQIERTGYSTTQDLIRSLPQNFSGGQAGATEDGVFGSGSDKGLNFTSATGINLRGLGNTSTLVLINGHRVAPSGFGNVVDVSLIPLAAIERIEILTDGSSAIYGADAVGGVVNIILRRDYSGAETALTLGSVTSGDRVERTAAQVLGRRWAAGGVVATLQYQDQDALEGVDRSFSSSLTEPNDLLPDTQSHAIALNVQHALNERFKIYGDALYSKRNVERALSSVALGGQVTSTDVDTEGLNVATGLRTALASSWSLDLGLQRSEQQGESRLRRQSVLLGSETATNDVRFIESSVDLILNGKLRANTAGEIGVAIGASYRDEDYRQRNVLTTGNALDDDTQRNVRAVFAELQVPLVSSDNRLPWVRTLDVSAAVRYDEYSDPEFGSSTTPRIGLTWSPASDWSIRTSFSKSFRAPTSLELSGRGQYALLVFPFTDPSGTGEVPVFALLGAQPLSAERARSFDAGIVYRPQSYKNWTVDLNYYSIRYRGRIIQPPPDPNALAQPDVFGSLITPLADDAAAQAFRDAELAKGTTYEDFLGTDFVGVRHVLDLRLQNAARVTQSGFDLLTSYTKALSGGTFIARANATLIDKIDTALAGGAAVTDLVNTFGNPTRWRLRLDSGWSSPAWAIDGALNYVGRYTNTSAVDRPAVSAWTTVDLTARLNVDRLVSGALWQDVSLSLSAQNVFDKAPPFLSAPILQVNYDPANANPLERFIVLQIRKGW